MSCCIEGCSSKSWMEGITFHGFPSPAERRQAWIDAVRTNQENFNPGRRTQICSNHFEPQSVVTYLQGLDRKKRLISTAVPTIFPNSSLPPSSKRTRLTTSSNIPLSRLNPVVELHDIKKDLNTRFDMDDDETDQSKQGKMMKLTRGALGNKDLTHILSDALDKGEFTDVTLVCEGGEEAEAHRSVLVSASPFLRMLLSDRPDSETKIFIPDSSLEEVLNLLQLMYSGHVYLTVEAAIGVQSLCKVLQIEMGKKMSLDSTSDTTTALPTNDSDSQTDIQRIRSMFERPEASNELLSGSSGIAAGKNEVDLHDDPLDTHDRPSHPRPDSSASVRRFACTVCPMVLGSAKSLENHQDVHIKAMTLEKLSTTRVASARTPGSSTAGQKSQGDSGTEDTGAASVPFACRLCSKTFFEEKSLEAHQFLHLLKLPWKRRADLRGPRPVDKHAKKPKGDQIGEDTGAASGPLGCHQCPKTFPDAKSLQDHRALHIESVLWERMSVIRKKAPEIDQRESSSLDEPNRDRDGQGLPTIPHPTIPNPASKSYFACDEADTLTQSHVAPRTLGSPLSVTHCSPKNGMVVQDASDPKSGITPLNDDKGEIVNNSSTQSLTEERSERGSNLSEPTMMISASKVSDKEPFKWTETPLSDHDYTLRRGSASSSLEPKTAECSIAQFEDTPQSFNSDDEAEDSDGMDGLCLNLSPPPSPRKTGALTKDGWMSNKNVKPLAEPVEQGQATKVSATAGAPSPLRKDIQASIKSANPLTKPKAPIPVEVPATIAAPTPLSANLLGETNDQNQAVKVCPTTAAVSPLKKVSQTSVEKANRLDPKEQSQDLEASAMTAFRLREVLREMILPRICSAKVIVGEEPVSTVYPCCYCTKAFYTVELRQEHFSTHLERSECPECHEQIQPHALYDHVQANHATFPFPLPAEKLTAPGSVEEILADKTVPTLVTYVMTPSNTHFYPCCYCQVACRTSAERNAHLKDHQVFTDCPMCTSMIYTHELVEHVTISHMENGMSCAPSNVVVPESKIKKVVVCLPPRRAAQLINIIKSMDLPRPVVAEKRIRSKGSRKVQYVYPCCYCTEYFTTIADRTEHFQSHTDIEKTPCPECKADFLPHELYDHVSENHVRLPNLGVLRKTLLGDRVDRILKGMKIPVLKSPLAGSGPSGRVYPCCYCEQVLNDFNSRQVHLTTHNVKMECPECKKLFPAHKLAFHVRIEHVSLPTDTESPDVQDHKAEEQLCGVCGGFFRNLQAHLRAKHGEGSTSIACSVCLDVTFEKTVELEKHIDDCHADLKKKCTKCDVVLYPHDEDSHFSTFHGRKKRFIPTPTACHICGRVVKFLAKHVAEVHEATRKRKNRRQEQACGECGKVFNSADTLKKHVTIDHGPSQDGVPCRICCQRFPDNDELARHKKKEHPLKKFTCSICKKTIISSKADDHLNDHVWDALKPHYAKPGQFERKSVECHTCKATFTCIYHLANHTLTHLDPSRAFSCDSCFKCFRTEPRLNWHKDLKCRQPEELQKIQTVKSRLLADKKKHRMRERRKAEIDRAKGKTKKEKGKTKKDKDKDDDTLETAFECVVCNAMFSTYEVCQAHIDLHHDGEYDNSGSD